MEVLEMKAVVESFRNFFNLGSVVLKESTIWETMVVRRKYLVTKMKEKWVDGRERLWNSAFDLIPLEMRNMEREGFRGVFKAPL